MSTNRNMITLSIIVNSIYKIFHIYNFYVYFFIWKLKPVQIYIIITKYTNKKFTNDHDLEFLLYVEYLLMSRQPTIRFLIDLFLLELVF